MSPSLCHSNASGIFTQGDVIKCLCLHNGVRDGTVAVAAAALMWLEHEVTCMRKVCMIVRESHKERRLRAEHQHRLNRLAITVVRIGLRQVLPAALCVLLAPVHVHMGMSLLVAGMTQRHKACSRVAA